MMGEAIFRNGPSRVMGSLLLVLVMIVLGCTPASEDDGSTGAGDEATDASQGNPSADSAAVALAADLLIAPALLTVVEGRRARRLEAASVEV